MAKAKRSTGNSSKSTVAREEIGNALMKLAHVRDLMEDIEKENFDHVSGAMFARTALCEAAGVLEQALFDLHVVRGIGGEPNSKEGWFVPQLQA